jgi:hypothetical protein
MWTVASWLNPELRPSQTAGVQPLSLVRRAPEFQANHTSSPGCGMPPFGYFVSMRRHVTDVDNVVIV